MATEIKIGGYDLSEINNISLLEVVADDINMRIKGLRYQKERELREKLKSTIKWNEENLYWELFSGKPGAKKASNDISRKFFSLINKGNKKILKGYSRNKILREILHQGHIILGEFEDYGATDSEPRWHWENYAKKYLITEYY